MERWLNKVAVVTGASSGIGAAICDALVEKGLRVVGLARRLNKLEEMQNRWQDRKGSFYPIQCDLAKEEDILKAFQWVVQNLGGVDVLVNNGGIAINETILRGSTESYRKILDVNTIAVAICSREAFKSMSERNVAGHIININSIVGLQTMRGPRHPVSFYAPSKQAVTGMSVQLQKEIDDENLNIKVTNLCPGLVRTEIGGTLDREDMYDTYPCMEVEDIAEAVVYVLGTPPNVVVSQLTIVPLNKPSPRRTTT